MNTYKPRTRLASAMMILAVCLSFLMAPAPVVMGQTGLSLASIFGNNAVLQRNMAVPVWGAAATGTLVTVTFNGQSKSVTAAGGTWRVNLDPMAALATPSNLMISGGGSTITLTGIQVGEVWVCSGQSNMLYALGNATGGSAAAADAPNHNIRLHKGAWQIANATTAGEFSAVCYWFGLELSNSLTNGVPIGLIQAAVGGTDVDEWYHAPGNRTGLLYEEYIVPKQPYAIRGANWYQGENDAHFNPDGYGDRLTGLINEWRADWGQGDFYFGIVQLHWNGTADGWPKVRQDELIVSETVPNTELAVAVDLPPGGGHPPTKQPIGYRLALAARAAVYGQNIVYSGPVRNLSTSYISGNKIVIGFDHVDGGLVTGSAYQPGGAPRPFKVAGTDSVYYDATATIVGNTIEVTSSSVPNPVSVRYIWNYYQGNLYNAAGLPAPSFGMTLSGGGPTPTSGPTNTPTQTNTPGGPTATPTQTPTRTNTPSGPTATPSGLQNIILDNTSSGVTITGAWTTSTGTAGYYGSNYLHDGNIDKGTKTVRFTPNLAGGTYDVYGWWAAASNRATNTPFTINHSGGTTTVNRNQTVNGSQWWLIGTFTFAAGTGGYVEIGTTATDGYVIADAVRFQQK